MGVYIPNMEMPEHCGECRFAVDGWCYAYGKPNNDALANDGRTNFCPLVPVPPHGRLIDADALNEAMARMVPWAIADPTANAFLDGLSAAYEVIQSAPTIIPAEEGEA